MISKFRVPAAFLLINSLISTCHVFNGLLISDTHIENSLWVYSKTMYGPYSMGVANEGIDI